MRLLLVLALLLVAVPCDARIFYIRSDGSNSATGVNNNNNPTNGAWKNYTKANSALIAGDTVIVVSLAAADTALEINPQNQGAPNAPITFLGDTTQQIPSIPCGTIRFFSPTDGVGWYTVVRGFRARTEAFLAVNKSFSGQALRGVRIEKCALLGGISIKGAQFCSVRNCYVQGEWWIRCPVDNSCYTTHHDRNYTPPAGCQCNDDAKIANQNDTIQYNLMYTTTTGPEVFQMQFECHSNSNVIADNIMRIKISGTGPAQGIKIYDCQFNQFLRNKRIYWSTVASSSSDNRWHTYMRDSAAFNVFRYDTLLADTNGCPNNDKAKAWTGRVCESGATGCFPNGTGDSAHNLFQNNFWKTDGYTIRAGSGDLWQTDFLNCAFASRLDSSFNFGQAHAQSINLKGNTFYGPVYLGALNSTSAVWCNIFARRTSPNCANAVVEIDQPYSAFHNYNLYYSYRPGTDSLNAIDIDAGCINPRNSAWNASGRDFASRWATPRFRDTTWATLDLTPDSGSVALVGWLSDCGGDTLNDQGSGYVGAYYRDWDYPDSATGLGVNAFTDFHVIDEVLSSGWSGRFSFLIPASGPQDRSKPSKMDIAYCFGCQITDANFDSKILYDPRLPDPTTSSGFFEFRNIACGLPGSLYTTPTMILDASVSGVDCFAVRIKDNVGNSRISRIGELRP